MDARGRHAGPLERPRLRRQCPPSVTAGDGQAVRAGDRIGRGRRKRPLQARCMRRSPSLRSAPNAMQPIGARLARRSITITFSSSVRRLLHERLAGRHDACSLLAICLTAVPPRASLIREARGPRPVRPRPARPVWPPVRAVGRSTPNTWPPRYADPITCLDHIESLETQCVAFENRQVKARCVARPVLSLCP